MWKRTAAQMEILKTRCRHVTRPLDTVLIMVCGQDEKGALVVTLLVVTKYLTKSKL